jgi:hypothetical protein
MKKKHKFPEPQQLIPNKKKEMLKIIQDPEAMKRVFELIDSSNNLFDKSRTVKAVSMIDWVERAIDILPDDLELRDSFCDKLRELVDNFGEKENGACTKQQEHNNK